MPGRMLARPARFSCLATATLLSAASLLYPALTASGTGSLPRPVMVAERTITAERLQRHIRVLASDEFEGRGPGTAGEEQTVRYLIDQFQSLGLKAGGTDGSWTQEVPMMGLTTEEPSMVLKFGTESRHLRYPDEAVIWSKQFVSAQRVWDSEVVFVGYGVVAPEYGWDDFKGVNVSGKTIVFLINDPPVPDPADPEKLDARMFKGRAMTYYGSWTYKFEIAAARCAAAALIVHEDGPAGYPWSVVVDSNAQENFELQTARPRRSHTPIQGWLRSDQARKLFAELGYDFDALKRRAASKDFQPVALGARASLSLKSRQREVRSRNVVARIDGADPRQRNEYVAFSAHWDHLGRDPRLAGDQIYNGALDNAAGVAALLELGRAFQQLKPAPRRTVLFLAVTAEEKGLLGSQYYVENPLYPINGTVANLNMDGGNAWGRTRDVEVIGYGQTTLEDWLKVAAARQGRVVTADSEPEKGRIFRSDQFEFAKVGVPALYLKSGVDYRGKPADFGRQKAEEYLQKHYHRLSDEMQPDWDLSGAVEDARLLFEVGWQAATAKGRPAWKAGAEFTSARQRAH